MDGMIWLIPIALAMGFAALMAFMWSVRNRQYDDMRGASMRILIDDPDDRPLP